ncbi:MAG TPA: hypothetical protein VGE55_10085 [Limnobacter sp.]|uniref:hypothetical protein n=1 Tax=Limnobacter sp. TaxID=2003368 RepID=UPI002EDA02B5
MGVTKKGGAVLSRLKSVAQAGAASLPAGNLLTAVVDQVSQFESGLKSTVDGLQDKVRSLQTNLMKMYQAHKELEQENQELNRKLIMAEKENAALSVQLERTEIELNMHRAKLENITRLLVEMDSLDPLKVVSQKKKRK